MNILNEHFEHFPIEFKEINPEHFEGFEVEDKTIISPNEEGYIIEALHSNIVLEDKNTVVINAGVGQGKTYSIIEIVKKYYQENKDYIIFIASPFVSLVEQYYHKVSETEIPQNEIYRYDWIGNRESNINPNDCRVHIVTANLLLGNPGEDSLISSEAKRTYINSLASKCKEQTKKVVFIYDEIHDTIHNFKQELVFNLWKWKDTIHKNFIISATFNEASKIVIEYLAELTDKKIQIIESERKRFPEKQSELYLHFNPASHYSYDNENITNIVKNIIERGKEIDILSYSKILIENIGENRDKGIGKVLSEKYGDNINLCISGLEENTPANNSQEERFSSKHRYTPNKCNIGTNFKSGVSIEKDNHAFVIIMPPLGAKRPFGNRYGIFSDGINSVIQALARQRKKGEIHIILPPPNSFDYSTLPLDEYQKSAFVSIYNEYISSTSSEPVKYLCINEQDKLIKDFYDNTICKNIKDEIEYISSLDRTSLASLNFPNYKDYKLAKGEKYLVRNHKFFGGDLSAYILYCAITNQFINCKLKDIFKATVLFQENSIYKGLDEFLLSELEEDYLYDVFGETTFMGAYNDFRNTLFKYGLKYERQNGNIVEIKPFENPNFEKQLLHFVADKYYGTYQRDRDIEYTRGDYFCDGIRCSEHINIETCSWDNDTKERIIAFQNLDYFRKKAISTIRKNTRGREYDYLLVSMPIGFVNSEDEISRFDQLKLYFTEKDNFIKNEVFPFKRNINKVDETKNYESFYKMLLDDFFVLEAEQPKIQIEGMKGRHRVKPIQEIKSLDKEITINHIEPEMEVISYLKEYYDTMKETEESAYRDAYREYL